jgi:hypothetical protein
VFLPYVHPWCFVSEVLLELRNANRRSASRLLAAQIACTVGCARLNVACIVHVTDINVFMSQGKSAWANVPVKNREEMTDEERSANNTPPRTAGDENANDVTPIDFEEPRTPDDVAKVQPLNLDDLLAEAERITATTPPRSSISPKKLEAQETLTTMCNGNQGLIEDVPLPAPEGVEDSIPHWERQLPLPPRPGTSSRRPESSSGRLVVYKTAAQKKVEQEARRKRLEAESQAAANHQLARPGTSSRKQSALPPLQERIRTKFSSAVAPMGNEVEVVGNVNESKGGAAWQLEAAEFVPEGNTCASPVKRVSGLLRPAGTSQKTDVFSIADDDNDDDNSDYLAETCAFRPVAMFKRTDTCAGEDLDTEH